MGLALLCVGEESHRGAGLAPECRSKRLIADWPKADRVGWRTCGQGATACRSTSGGLDNHRTPGINPGGSPCGLLDGSDDPVAVKTTGFKSRCTARSRPTARSATSTKQSLGCMKSGESRPKLLSREKAKGRRIRDRPLTPKFVGDLSGKKRHHPQGKARLRGLRAGL